MTEPTQKHISLHLGLDAPETADMDQGLLAALKANIFARDGFACRACGAPAAPSMVGQKGGLCLHCISANPGDMRPENWASLCPLCHGVMHLDRALETLGGAYLWLPGISQADLNLLIHSVALVRSLRKRYPQKGEDADYALALAESCASLCADLSSMGELPQDFLSKEAGKLGYGRQLADNPMLLVQVMRMAALRGRDCTQSLQRVLSGLRWVCEPARDPFVPLMRGECGWPDGENWVRQWQEQVKAVRDAFAGPGKPGQGSNASQSTCPASKAAYVRKDVGTLGALSALHACKAREAKGSGESTACSSMDATTNDGQPCSDGLEEDALHKLALMLRNLCACLHEESDVLAAKRREQRTMFRKHARAPFGKTASAAEQAMHNSEGLEDKGARDDEAFGAILHAGLHQGVQTTSSLQAEQPNADRVACLPTPANVPLLPESRLQPQVRELLDAWLDMAGLAPGNGPARTLPSAMLPAGRPCTE